MSIRNVRQMSAVKKSPTIYEIEQKRELPKDLHPMFYKLKADQKLYQVCIDQFKCHLAYLDNVLIMIFLFSSILATRRCTNSFQTWYA